MNMDAEIWKKVSQCFDELVELDASERVHRLDACALSDEARQWLESLLRAHDATTPSILDESVDELVQALSSEIELESFALPEGHRLGPWRIVRELGRGGMAVVYLGERADGRFEKQVAIKALNPRLNWRVCSDLQSELRILARLEHPNIARLIDGGVEDKVPYLVLEYVQGGRNIVQYSQQERLSLDERIRLFIQVLDAVSYAHGQLVVHADIKPSNVLVDASGKVKLLDFGISGLLGSEKKGFGLVPFCSPAYAAPEQFSESTLGVSVDVYGLGALLYELLAGSRVRNGSQITRLLLGRVEQEAIPLPSQRVTDSRLQRKLKGDLDAICMKALAFSAQDRYPSAGALKADLIRWLKHEPVLAREGGQAYKMGCWMRRHKVGFAAAVLVAVSLLGGTVVALWQANKAEQKAKVAASVSDFLLEMFSGIDPWKNKQQPVSVNELVDWAVQTLPQRLKDSAEEKARIQLLLGDILKRSGRHQDALPLVQQSLDILRQQDDQAELHKGLNLLISLYLDMQQYPEARQVLDEALALGKWPSTNAQSIRTRLLLVQCQTSTGEQLEDQGRLIQELLALLPRVQAERKNQSLTAEILMMAAEHAETHAEYTKAIEYAQQASDILQNMHGSRHPSVARAKSYIATSLYAAGQYEPALQALRQITEIFREYYGPRHPEVMWAEYTTGRVLIDAGKIQQARDLFERLAKEVQQLFGEGDPRLGLIYANLAKLERLLGRPQEALRYSTLGLPMVENSSPESPKLGVYYVNHAQFLAENQCDSEAETYFIQGVSLLTEKLGEPHPVSSQARMKWARYLLQQGKTDEATALVQAAMPVLEQTFTGKNLGMAEFLDTQAMAMQANGDTQQAVASRKKALQLLEQAPAAPFYQQLRQQITAYLRDHGE